MLAALVAQIALAPLLKGRAQQAWSMQPVEELSEDTPACFVFPERESADPNQYDTGVLQEISTDWALMIVCETATLEALRSEIRAKVLGWQAGAAYTPMTFATGEAVDIKGDYIWWLERYRSSIHVTSTL